MRLACLAVAAIFCVACDDITLDASATPAATDVDRLEQMLARHRCVGPLDEWERNFRFSRRTATLYGHSLNPNLDVIEFHLRRAGTVIIEPGRHVMAPKPDSDWPDSAPMQSVDGQFTVSSGALSVRPCRSRPQS